MSVVVGFSFPEEAIIVSDSRISFVKNKVIVGSHDNLRKVFALTPQLAIGFVCDDVDLTYKLISKLQEYIQYKAKRTITYCLLQKLPRVANYEYKQLSKGRKTKPVIEFIYAGLLGDRPLTLPEPVVMELMIKNGGGAVPEPFGKALMKMRNGYLTMDPPTPVIMKQNLFSGYVSDLGVYTTGSIGSGESLGNLFGKEYSKLLTCDPSPISTFRSNLIRIYLDDYIKTSNIPSVGGAIQVLRINAKGVKGVKSCFKRIFSDSSVVDISSMDYDGEKWTYTNHETGTIEVVESRFPDILK